MAFRSPNSEELSLLRALAAGIEGLAEDWVSTRQVEPITGERLGPMRLSRDQVPAEYAADELATLKFEDADGVAVMAFLLGDANGVPFEIDLWKVDETPVIRIPEDLPHASAGDQ